MDESEFPRALCHQEVIDERIQNWEMEHSTPINEEEMHEIMMGVEADFEDCDCDCCSA